MYTHTTLRLHVSDVVTVGTHYTLLVLTGRVHGRRPHYPCSRAVLTGRVDGP